MTKNEKERILRAVARLKRSGNEHPTDEEVANESAIPVEKVASMNPNRGTSNVR